MGRLHKYLLAVAIVGLFGISAPAAKADICSLVPGNLVTNCGFETNDFTGWTLGGNTAFTGTGNFGPGPNSGNFDAFFGSLGTPVTLGQSIVTTPGTTYTISFFLRNHNSTPPNAFSASFGGQALPISLVNSAAFPYTQFTFSVVATSSSSLLQFTFLHDPSEWFLDDVSVTAVPEPATLLLIGSGLMGVAAAVRRRHKKRIS